MTRFIERLLLAAKHADVGESQSDIADALGLKRQTVNRWFKTGGEPDADTTLDIARRWKVSAEWLKQGSGEMLPNPEEGLSQKERELIRNLRRATPQVQEVILKMARAARKSVVTLVLAVPPLLASQSGETSILHIPDYTFAAVRRWLRLLCKPYALTS
jgi:transcriptional regulator with XRE-family HTH domain